MSADTRYYVQIIKPLYKWVEIYAITSDHAVEQANRMPNVIGVNDVKHWSEYEEGNEC